MAGDDGEIDGRGKECAFIIYHSAHTLSVLRAADGVLPAGPNEAESGAELVISADSIRVLLLGIGTLQRPPRSILHFPTHHFASETENHRAQRARASCG